jgi:hypothetical protein
MSGPRCGGAILHGRPDWPAFGWRNTAGEATVPLARGGWSNGEPASDLPPPPSLRFLAGPSLPLHYWRSVAADPHLIPLGSRIFVHALCDTPSRGAHPSRYSFSTMSALLVGGTGAVNDILLASAVVPPIIAIIVCRIAWVWAKTSEEDRPSLGELVRRAFWLDSKAPRT